jgi:hypothetical protein
MNRHSIESKGKIMDRFLGLTVRVCASKLGARLRRMMHTSPDPQLEL